MDKILEMNTDLINIEIDTHVPVGLQAMLCAIDCKTNWPVFCQ